MCSIGLLFITNSSIFSAIEVKDIEAELDQPAPKVTIPKSVEDVLAPNPRVINITEMVPENAMEYVKTHEKDNPIAMSPDAKIKDIFSELPNLKKNYTLLHEKCQKAKKMNIPRKDMPVIFSKDIDKFKKRLENGYLDINEPHANHRYFLNNVFPKDLNKRDDAHSKIWLILGRIDNEDKEDKIPAKIENVPAKNLNPTQSEIWLDYVLYNMYKFGIVNASNTYVLEKETIIISKDGFILDGHHRFAQVILSDPELEMKCLRVDLPIDDLLKVGVPYGNAIGNKQQD